MDKLKIYNDLKNLIKQSTVLLDEQMSKHTSFKIGGSSDIFIKVKNIEELKNIIKYSKNEKIPITIIGNGSNILVKDKGIRGITIQIALAEFKINVINKNIIDVYVEAGVKISEIARKITKRRNNRF